MYELFTTEIEAQCKTLTDSLLALESDPTKTAHYTSLMRAAHSIKGAAQVIGLPTIVHLAHRMEDRFIALQQRGLLSKSDATQLLRAVEAIGNIAKISREQFETYLTKMKETFETLANELAQPLSSPVQDAPVVPVEEFTSLQESERVLRLTAVNMTHLMGLAGEMVVESGQWDALEQKMLGDRRRMLKAQNAFVKFQNHLQLAPESIRNRFSTPKEHFDTLVHSFQSHLSEMSDFTRHHAAASEKLYEQLIASRMRPFGDIAETFPLKVRDLALTLGKEVRLEVTGQATLLDRDILEKLESPLNHLLRNAIDHGIESASERKAAGKSSVGVIRLSAEEKGGRVHITVADDGRGIDSAAVRHTLVENKVTNERDSQQMSDQELLAALFLPNVSTSSTLSETSGRGMGLAIVQQTVATLGGKVRIVPTETGLSFILDLPTTLAVTRALVVSLSYDLYALPLSQINRTLSLGADDCIEREGQLVFMSEGASIPLFHAKELFGQQDAKERKSLKNVLAVEISYEGRALAIVFDRLIGEKELALQEIDERLKKIPLVTATALAADSSCILLLNPEEVAKVALKKEWAVEQEKKKRVLIVDDSAMMRKQLQIALSNRGYRVSCAVNGLDAWNALCVEAPDLILTDWEMPVIDGIALIQTIKRAPALASIPIIMLTHREDEESRQLSLAAGAAAFITKNELTGPGWLALVEQLIKRER